MHGQVRLRRKVSEVGGRHWYCGERQGGQGYRGPVMVERVNAAGEAGRRSRAAAAFAAESAHPAVPTALGVTTHRGWLFVVRDAPEAVPLRQLLAHGPLDPRAALEVGAQVAAALVRPARQAGASWCHRQLDPDTVWVTRDGAVLLMDLHSGSFLPPGELTRGPTPWSLYTHRPPEGEASGPAADVFGLAMLLIELLRGSPLSGHSLNPAAHGQRLARARAAVADRLGPLAWAAIESMLTADPRQRADLESARSGLALLAQRAPGRRLREVVQSADLDQALPPDDAWVGQTLRDPTPAPARGGGRGWWALLLLVPPLLAGVGSALTVGCALLTWALLRLFGG